MKCTEIKIHLLPLTAQEYSELGKHPFSKEIELEAAMCAWEAAWRPEDFEWEEGAGQLRLCCGAISYAIHIGYCVANVDDRLDGYAYDWEFVPWFINNCVKWDSEAAFIYGTPQLVDNWVELCRNLDFSTPDPEPEPEPSDEDLLREAVKIFNTIPNQHGSYDLAAKIDRRLTQ